MRKAHSRCGKQLLEKAEEHVGIHLLRTKLWEPWGIQDDWGTKCYIVLEWSCHMCYVLLSTLHNVMETNVIVGDTELFSYFQSPSHYVCTENDAYVLDWTQAQAFTSTLENPLHALSSIRTFVPYDSIKSWRQASITVTQHSNLDVGQYIRFLSYFCLSCIRCRLSADGFTC